MAKHILDSVLTSVVLKTVQNLARVYCSGIDSATCDPDDAAQVAFFKLYRKAETDPTIVEKIKNPAWLAAYCGRAIRWYLVQEIRKSSRGKFVPLPPNGEPAAENLAHPLDEIEALNIFHQVYQAAGPDGRKLLEAMIAEPGSQGELAQALGIQRATVRRWLLHGLPPLRDALERVLERQHGQNAKQLLGEAIEQIVTLLHDDEWISNGCTTQVHDLNIALKKLRMSIGAQKYEEAKMTLDAKCRLVVSLIESRMSARQIFDILAQRSHTVASPPDPADYKVAKIELLKVLPQIRGMIESR